MPSGHAIAVEVDGRRFDSLTELAARYDLSHTLVIKRYREGLRGAELIRRPLPPQGLALGPRICLACDGVFPARQADGDPSMVARLMPPD